MILRKIAMTLGLSYFRIRNQQQLVAEFGLQASLSRKRTRSSIRIIRSDKM